MGEHEQFEHDDNEVMSMCWLVVSWVQPSESWGSVSQSTFSQQ